MTSREIVKSFLDFFAKKGHKIVPSSSLIPADPLALFTSAGMQQFEPYLSGQVEPPYQKACSNQKCFRTSDIDLVGDEFHHTFFEMLGNWSFGSYFKEEAIEFALEFLIENCKLSARGGSALGGKIENLWITVFKGEKGIPRDEESYKIWQKNGIPKERIYQFGMEDNFWGPVSETGPCGPCSEIHYDRGNEFRTKKCSQKKCGPNCSCGRFIEIWNLVFMEYHKKFKAQNSKLKTKEYEFVPLPKKNVDTGAGLERLTAVLQNKKSSYETDLFYPVIQNLEQISSKSYTLNPKPYRVIADHLRAVCFLVADGVLPSKEDRGYVLRRILRRSIRYGRLLELKGNFLIPLADLFIKIYSPVYTELSSHQNEILTVIQKEEEKFSKTLTQGLNEFNKLIKLKIKNQPSFAKASEGRKPKIIEGEKAFYLYESYGFPLELTKEMAKEKDFKVDETGFQQALLKHQEISRAGANKKFGGLGISETDTEEERLAKTKLHTATHLLHSALRKILGAHVKQSGSDINSERLRFDFTHPNKLAENELKAVSSLVNQKIKENLKVEMKEMFYEKAIKSGALAFFKEKYPKIVKVYTIGSAFSREICAGPHIENTNQLGHFKIIKEESSGAGVRRIKAILI